MPSTWARSRLARERAAVIAGRLRLLRERAALTELDVVRRSGIGLDLYHRLEAGDVDALGVVTVDLLWAVTEAVGSDPAELLRRLG